MADKKAGGNADKPVFECQGGNGGTPHFDPAPREMLVRITMSCNQNCIFCNTYHLKDEQLTCRDVYIACKDMPAAGKHPIFTGGEPTLHANIYEMIGIAHKLGLQRIGVQTNALRFAEPGFARALRRVGLSYATVSLHSHDPELSDAITGSPGDFKRTCEGIRNMVRQNIYVGINHVLNAVNYKDTEKFVNFINEELFGGLNCSPSSKYWFLSLSVVQPIGRAEGAFDIVPKLSDLSPYFVDGLRRAVELGIFVINPGCGIPVCFTPGYEELSSEYHSLLRQELDIGTFPVKERLKAKGPQCVICRYNSLCLGVWRAYSEMYGVEELKPVADEQERR